MNGKECEAVEDKIPEKKCREYRREIRVLGREIRIRAYDTGAGINVLIEGGDKGHIGAAAAAMPGAETVVTAFPGHREDVVCRQWAERISGVSRCAAVVEAGVHYDGIGKPEIGEILSRLEDALGELTDWIKESPV